MGPDKLISNVQALRALAALTVALYHTQFAIAGVSSSYFGVELFFCISGFVMTHVSRQEDGSAFLRARLVRIVPLYWLATLAFFLWNQLGLSNPPYTWPILWERLWNDPPGLWQWVTANVVMDAPTWEKILKSLLFIPYVNHSGTMHPLLGVGWTLNLEMFFYVVFAAALAIHRQLAPVLVAAVLLVARALLADAGAPWAFFSHAYLSYFIFGIACYYAWAGLPAGTARVHGAAIPVIAAAAGGLFFWAGWWTQLPSAGMSPLAGAVSLLAPPLVLYVALWCESRGLRVRSRAVLELGAASYALYLFHPFVMEAARPVGAAWPWADASRVPSAAGVALLLSVVLALAVHRLVERPLLRLLKKRFVPRPRPVLPLQAMPGGGV
jgi:exopolysaccharide production protein ExoZ